MHFVHTVCMSTKNILSTTKARDILPDIIDHVQKNNSVFVIGRRSTPEVVVLRYPTEYSVNSSDITNINAYSHSFDFLHDEPDIYKVKIKK